MREKFTSFIDAEFLSTEEYAIGAMAENGLRHRAGFISFKVAIAALFAAGPSLSLQLTNEIRLWMVIAAGAAVAYSAYCYLVASYWDFQLRQYRYKRVLDAKRENDNKRLLESIGSSALENAPSPPKWAADPPEELISFSPDR